MSGPAVRRFLTARRRFAWEEHVVSGGLLRVRRATTRPRSGTPNVILLPGLALSGHYVLPVGAELAHRFPVHVPNLPGHVRDSRDRAALDVPELGDVVADWLQRHALGPAVLVANSMGCQIAVETAARHPDQVSHLVLEGPTIDAEARGLLRQLGRVLLAGRREPMSLGPLQLVDWITMGPRGVIGTVRHTFAHRVEERIPAVRCPTLVVRGALDPIVPQRWAEQLVAGLPRAQVVVIPQAGHALPYSHPRELAALVDGFLAGTSMP